MIDPPGSIAFTASAKSEQLVRVLSNGFTRLKQMGIDPTPGRTSPDYLPKKIIEHSFSEGLTKKELEQAMWTSGCFKKAPDGQYGNRGKSYILVMIGGSE